jgi:LysR family transcriptional regulator, transcription activator of glutamate synthase operon
VTFDQITYFLAIVDHENFSHAAEMVFISQSSLSKQIKALENELGVSLFSRDNYKIELTEAGKAFLPFAREFAKNHSNMMYHLSSFSHIHPSGLTIKVGTIPILCYHDLVNVLADLESNNQNIHIDLLEREQCELIKMLDKGQIDFAIARINYLSPADYDFIPLAREAIGVLCPLKSNFASKKMLSLRDLKNESFVLLNSTSSLYKLCIDSCRDAGFTPQVNYVSSRHEALLAMVNTGLGLTLLPKSLLDLENSKRLKFVPLQEQINSTIALIRKKDMEMNNKINTFQMVIREHFKEYYSES